MASTVTTGVAVPELQQGADEMIPEIALVSAISGVCSAWCTLVMT